MKFIEAVLILSGMIIGVGMFGIPFSFARAGFWLGTAELIILAGVTLLLHLIYGEIVLHTPSLHRLPGYINIYLGDKAAAAILFIAVLGMLGTLLAYMVVGSSFLNNIFSGTFGSSVEWSWAWLVAGAGALITFFPLRREAFLNGILTAFLVAFILFLMVILWPQVEFKNLSGVDFQNSFLPYGVLLFALSGGVVVPDLITLLNKNRRSARGAIVVGTLIPAFIYFLFALAVVGVVGPTVSEETIKSLGAVNGGQLVFLGSVIGFLAVFTSYIALSKSFQAMLRLDLGFNKFWSWFGVSAAPVVLYWLGFQNFILIISIMGAVAGGLEAAFILAAHHVLYQRGGRSHAAFSYLWKTPLFIMFLAGMFYELYVVFSRAAPL